MTSKLLTAATVALMIALSACGGSDEKEKDSGKATAEPPKGPNFKAADVGFTFSYPSGLEQVDEPNDGKVLASVTPTPNDPNNGIKVRKTAEKVLPFASYASQIKGQFEEQLATKLTQREEKRGSLDVGVLEWRKAYEKEELGQKKTVRLHSISYFFTGGGKTWQVECLSGQEQRAVIDKACKQALDSIKFG